jgi:DNA-binding transcriptional MerR regulator
MSASSPSLWTIDELGTCAALALSVDYAGPPNGRVREVPDRRTIRYYTTLGLLDRPAEMRGRTALYGRRHLLQLVAIKRLQARGLSLAELQKQLLGLPDAELERLAQLPADLPKAGVPAEPRQPTSNQRAAAFWSTAPAPVPEATEQALSRAENGEPLSGAVVPLQGILLADDVTLLLGASRPLEPDDLEAIRVVAEPLLKLLDRRRLLGPRQERSPS